MSKLAPYFVKQYDENYQVLRGIPVFSDGQKELASSDRSSKVSASTGEAFSRQGDHVLNPRFISIFDADLCTWRCPWKACPVRATTQCASSRLGRPRSRGPLAASPIRQREGGHEVVHAWAWLWLGVGLAGELSSLIEDCKADHGVHNSFPQLTGIYSSQALVHTSSVFRFTDENGLLDMRKSVMRLPDHKVLKNLQAQEICGPGIRLASCEKLSVCCQPCRRRVLSNAERNIDALMSVSKARHSLGIIYLRLTTTLHGARKGSPPPWHLQCGKGSQAASAGQHSCSNEWG